jgi:hypothetical protein
MLQYKISQTTVIVTVTTERTPHFVSQMHSLLCFEFLAPRGCHSQVQIGCTAMQMTIDRNWTDRLAVGTRTILLFKVITTEIIPHLCDIFCRHLHFLYAALMIVFTFV